MSVKLNIGCGNKQAEGFVNVDIRWEVKPDVVADVRWLPFRSGSVEYLYASHIIEHFSHRETNQLLQGWIDLLAPGGILFITCPDIETIFRSFGIVNFDEWIRQVFGGQDYPFNFHCTGFTKVSLAQRLCELGLMIDGAWCQNGNVCVIGVKN